MKKQKIISKKTDDAQLLILAGVVITILLVVSSILSVNLSISNRPSNKETYIRSDYVNVKEKFGYALDDNLDRNLMQYEDVVYTVFNDTLKQFKFSLSRYDYFFDAEIEEIRYIADQPEGIYVSLLMGNKFDSMSETVYYYIE